MISTKYCRWAQRKWLSMSRRQRSKTLGRLRRDARRAVKRRKGDHRNWMRTGRWQAMSPQQRGTMTALAASAGAGILFYAMVRGK